MATWMRLIQSNGPERARPTAVQPRRPSMDRIMMSQEIDHQRRRFLGTGVLTVAAAKLGLIGPANAQAGQAKRAQLPAIKPGTNTSFGPLKQIDAGLLNVGY